VKNPEEVFARLAQSKFRSQMRLGAADADHLSEKSAETIRRHAAELSRRALLPRIRAMTANKHRRAVIPSSWRNMPRQLAVAYASKNGTASRKGAT